MVLSDDICNRAWQRKRILLRIEMFYVNDRFLFSILYSFAWMVSFVKENITFVPRHLIYRIIFIAPSDPSSMIKKVLYYLTSFYPKSAVTRSIRMVAKQIKILKRNDQLLRESSSSSYFSCWSYKWYYNLFLLNHINIHMLILIFQMISFFGCKTFINIQSSIRDCNLECGWTLCEQNHHLCGKKISFKNQWEIKSRVVKFEWKLRQR